MKENRTTLVSKKLSHMLRHSPETYGVTLDSNGWADANEVVEALGISFENLCFVVETNDKKRFEMDKFNVKIRANQGHSIPVDLELEERVPPKHLYHGTCINFTPNIDDFGLKKMNRNHVHLSDNPQTASEVGRRHGESFVYMVKSGEMHAHGFKFYLSNNGVWLTDSVPPEYLVG